MHITAECLVCGAPGARQYTTRKTEHDSFTVLKCSTCGSAFVWPRPDAATVECYYRGQSRNDLTAAQAERPGRRYYPDAAGDARRIIGACRHLAQGNRFLDVGAGFGPFSRAARERGFTVAACEPNHDARAVFREVVGFEPEPVMFDAAYAAAHADTFDVVLMSQVLEHVTDPAAVAHHLSTVLRPGGLAAIAVPHFGSALSRLQGQRDMYISPPGHLNFFSRRGLTSLFAHSGFIPERIDTASKVPCGRVTPFPVPLLQAAAWRLLYAGLACFHPVGLGMFLNAYFRNSRRETQRPRG